MTTDPIDVPDDVGIPSVDVCSFCSDSECDGIGCIAGLDPDDLDDQGLIEQLHDLIRAGAAWKIMQTHGYTVAERVLARAEHRREVTQPEPEQPREMGPVDDGEFDAPAGCVALDGVLYCVAHDGIIDELSCRQNRDGDVVCDQWDEYDDVCRMVPLFIRVVEVDPDA